MKLLCLFSLAILASLSVGGCAATHYVQTSLGKDCVRAAMSGDTKIRIYCLESSSSGEVAWSGLTARAPEDIPGNTSCRWLGDAFGPMQKVCNDAAQWDQFDTLAASTGVTCQWSHRLREFCLSTAQTRYRSPGGSGSNWPTNDSLEGPGRGGDPSAVLSRLQRR
jgi:hypothetical protein